MLSKVNPMSHVIVKIFLPAANSLSMSNAGENVVLTGRSGEAGLELTSSLRNQNPNEPSRG